MLKVALFGNPNTGKSSLFNRLTGLRQKVGNFPGVTVDKSFGFLSNQQQKVQIIDFPGTYSVYPRSKDEQVVFDVLSQPNHSDFPDIAVVLLDAANLERNLLLFTQIYDLGIPCVAALNMTDIAQKRNMSIDIEAFKTAFPNVEVFRLNARVGLGIQDIRIHLLSLEKTEKRSAEATLIPLNAFSEQEKDTRQRFERIKEIKEKVVHHPKRESTRSQKLDQWITHPIFGYLLFIGILFILFQTVFSFASYPMDWIEFGFGNLSEMISKSMPVGLLNDLICEGIIPGIAGVLVFIPQIALLFFLLGLLEETGYMSRVVFIMDKLVRPFGLNGKSVVPLISSAACAIPGIMAARTISSWQERIRTIMVAPLISCSARIPVYTLLITLVIPNKIVFGFINLQALVLLGLYLLGIVGALFVSWCMKIFTRSKEQSIFLLELPSYKLPRWGNVFMEMLQKVKMFVFDAGKIILAISIVLWVLASFGPSNAIDNAEKSVQKQLTNHQITSVEYEDELASAKLEASYMGVLGKSIEPVIRPLGYDWRIGISLITSFAAREVFVGSISTIYSVHQDDETVLPLIKKLENAKNANGEKVYTLATGVSLLVFYAFAMQCMATLAVVKRETKSWKWPIIQLVYMGIMAYLGAFIAYQLLS